MASDVTFLIIPGSQPVYFMAFLAFTGAGAAAFLAAFIAFMASCVSQQLCNVWRAGCFMNTDFKSALSFLTEGLLSSEMLSLPIKCWQELRQWFQF